MHEAPSEIPSNDAGPPAPRAHVQDMVSAGDGRGGAITDKIPIRPVGVVEGTAYTLAIVAALAVSLAGWGWRAGVCVLRL